MLRHIPERAWLTAGTAGLVMAQTYAWRAMGRNLVRELEAEDSYRRRRCMIPRKRRVTGAGTPGF